MSRPRVYAVGSSNILALRNPIRETQIEFERRALRLAYEQEGLEVGDVDPDPSRPDNHKGRAP